MHIRANIPRNVVKSFVIMNANKKSIMSGGWILCPSKTFPGKFYYFNVLNGEAAWSLGDAEKKITKNPIPKVQESHHPEPTSPPIEPLIPLNRIQTPVFGQSGFPKVPLKHEENVIWTPIHIQVPIVVPKRSDQKQSPKAPVKMLWEFNKDLFIHASSKPLSQRFINFENPVINFDKHNKVQNVLQFNNYMDKLNVSMEGSRNNEGNFKATKTIASNTEFPIGLSFTDLRQKQLIRESVFNIEIPSETEVQKQIEPDGVCDTDFGMEQDDCNQRGFGFSLDGQNKFGGDLRNLLLAKKRKCFEANDSEEVECKKLKFARDEPTPKKRVSFNLDTDISNSEDEKMNFREKCLVTIQILRDLAGTVEDWYLVVDPEVLLDEFSFIDSFVQIDPQCKLVIPSPAMSYVSAASRGPHAATARSILRRLDAPYIIVQSDDVTESLTPNDIILKCCIDAANRNIHVVLVTKDLELLTAAKCYPIHSYHINSIKNGLTPKPKEYKQNMKITIRNTKANIMENGPAENMFANEDLNEKEEVLKHFKQNKVNLITKESFTPNVSNSRISIENCKFSLNKSCIDQTSINNPSIITSLNANKNNNLLINSQKETMNLREKSQTQNSMNSQINQTNSQDSINSISMSHLFNTTKELFNAIGKKDKNISNISDKKSLTDWRYVASDTTETTIEMDMYNLNIKEKNHKIDKNTNQTKHNEISYFQTSTPKIDHQKFKNRTYVYRENVGEGSNFEIQNLNFKMPVFQNQDIEQESNFEIQKSKFNTPMFHKRGNEKDSNFNIQKSNLKTSMFQNYGNERDSYFETHKPISKEPQFKNGTESIFEVDVFKKNKPLNWTKRNTGVDLSNFYVKNKVMDNRLKERMDEFLCSYKQIMEEFLSSILEKLSPSVLKTMTPPWSFYEALQCAKNVYKDHVMVTNIVDQLIGYLYEASCGIDKMKIIVTPNEFIKALGCGIHLIQYLKKILQPSAEILDYEQQLTNILKQVEDPTTDIIEPLVKTPVVNSDFVEVRQNFVKTRTDIINYLKRHYTEWQSYKEVDNTMKIVRTFGRNLNMLKLERVKEVKTAVDENDDVIQNNALKNVDVAINVESGAKDVENVATNSKTPLDCTKLPAFGDAQTKNVGLFVMKEVDCGTKNEKSEQRIKIVQEKNNTIRKQIDQHTDCDSKDTKKPDNAKPKAKSIFDFVIPKKTRNLENQRDFKNDTEILDVKITIPNGTIQKGNREENDHKFEKKCTRKLNMNTNDDKNTKKQEINQNGSVSKTDNEKGIKIVRNVYLIEEFEKRLKNKPNLDLDLDLSLISDSDDDLTYISNTNKCNETDKNYNIDSNSKKSHQQIGSINQLNNKLKDTELYDINNYNYNKNKDIKINENGVNLKNLDKRTNDPNNVGSDPKSDKDDLTDSGLGNESPRVYSMVKSFTSELENSLEIIHTFIDGSLQEFRRGKISEETKIRFRLKAFESNFLITKIIRRLKKLAQKDSDKISKNAEAVTRCLEQAELLQKSYNMILLVTNETNSQAELNSSMSLNLSS